jgi:tetratricopeptide (TPR) repeat protein
MFIAFSNARVLPGLVCKVLMIAVFVALPCVQAQSPLPQSSSPQSPSAPLQLQYSVLKVPFQLGGALASDTSVVNLGMAHFFPSLISSMLVVHSTIEETSTDQYQRVLFPNEKAMREWISGKAAFPKEIVDEDFRDRFILTGVIKSDKAKPAPTIDVTIADRQTNKQTTKTLPLDLPSLVDFQTGFLALLDESGLGVTAAEKARMTWREDLPKPAFDLACKHYYWAMRLDYNSATADQVLKATRETAAAAPKSYLATVDYATSLQVANYARNIDEAKRTFERALTLHQNGYYAVNGLFYIALDQSDADALKTWSIRRATIQGKSGDQTLAEFYAAQAQAATAKKNYGKASELYIKALEFNRYPLYTRKMAKVLALAGNIGKAEQILRSEMRDAKNELEREVYKKGLSEIWSDRGDVFWTNYLNTKEASDLGAAIVSYRRAMNEWINPMLAAQAVKANTYPPLSEDAVIDTVQTMSRDIFTRLQGKQERMKFSTELARSLNLRAQEFAAHNDSAKHRTAERLLRYAVALDPEDFSHTYYLLDVLISKRNKLIEAETMIADAMVTWKTDKSKVALLWNWRGAVALKKGDYATAVNLYRNAVAITPDLNSSLEGLGAACVQSKRYAEAIPPLERRVLYDSSSADAFRMIGVSYFHLQNMTKSKLALQKSWALNSKGNESAFYLARVLTAQKDFAEALKFLEVSLQNNLITMNDVESDTTFAPLRTLDGFNTLRGKYKR